MMAQITTDDLRQMEGKEGLNLQGCGGPIQEWIDGINDLLTEEGILLNGSRFTKVSSFQNDGLTNLLFHFDGVELKTGALAMWRLQTHSQFGGTWLSDYVPRTAELRVSLEPPHGQSAGFQFHTVEGEEQVGQAVMLEGGHVGELGPVQQNARLGEQAVDPINPLLDRSAAALKDQALLAFHLTEIVSCDLCHHCSPPICIGFCS